MIRLILIFICTYALANTALSSDDWVYSTAFPLVGFSYALYAYLSFIITSTNYLRQSGFYVTGEMENPVSKTLILAGLIFDSVKSHYENSFQFIGGFQFLLVMGAVLVEFWYTAYSIFHLYRIIGAALWS